MKNNYRIEGDAVYIELKRRDGSTFEAIIDLDDLELASGIKGRWYAVVDNRFNNIYCYARPDDGKRNCTKIKLHRHIMNAPKGLQVDHLNHNGLDNRKCNLRVVTDGENKQNFVTPRKNKTDQSLPVGVHYAKDSNTWIVTCSLNGDTLYYHEFTTKDLAVETNIYVRSYYMPYSFEASTIADRENSYNKIKQLEIEDATNPSRANNKSGYRNVSWHRRIKKWVVALTVNKETIHIGYFNDIEEAALAAREARHKYGISKKDRTAG